MRGLAVLGALAGCACSSELLPPGVAVLSPGHEPDPWGRAPEVARVRVGSEAEAGTRTVLETRSPPLARFSLGYRDPARFVVSGVDEGGQERVCARSLEVDPVGLAAQELPLFVARSGELARPPGLLSSDLEAPVVAVAGARVLLAAAGTAGGRLVVDGYDLATWSPVVSTLDLECPATPCRVTSLLVVDAALALVLGDDWAVSLDLAEGAGADLPPPEGLTSWATLAGGRAIATSDGGGWLVGATREGEPTSAVLRADPDGGLHAFHLGAPRAGAAAAWVPGRGLVVVGGSGTGAGLELLADGGSAFDARPFPPDATSGAGLAATDASRLLRAGGRDASGAGAATVEYDPGCGEACAPEPAGAAVPLESAVAFALSGGGALVVGRDEAGETGAWALRDGVASAVALREPRAGSAATAVPTGHVALVGGRLTAGGPARTLELFTPPGLCELPVADAGD